MTEQKKLAKGRRNTFYLVSSLSVKNRVLNKAAFRKDKWGETVAKRIEGVFCLVAAEAWYHTKCYTKFCNPLPIKKVRGRPKDENVTAALEKLCNFINDSDECQFTLNELMKIMKDNLAEETQISQITLRRKPQEEYGDGVIFGSISKRGTIVCFRGTSFNSRLIDGLQKDSTTNEKEKQMKIVETAASIILEDIRSTPYNINDYPSLSNFTDGAENDIPETLQVF